MNRWHSSLVLFVLPITALSLIAASASGGAQSGALVRLQASTPGIAQNGSINVLGTTISGQFVGNGSGLTNLNASSLSSGTLLDSRLSANVPLRSTANTFAGLNRFDGFVGIKRDSRVTSSESFGIGSSATTSFDGMYVMTGATGKPFYGYALNGGPAAYHYIDGSDSNKWKLYNGGQHLTVTSDGKMGVGTTNPLSTLHVNGSATVQGLVLAPGAGATRILTSDSAGVASWADPLWREEGEGSVVLNSTRKVGIGTTPWGLLDVSKNVGHPVGIFQNNYSQLYPYMKAGILATAGGTSSAYGVYAHADSQGTTSFSFGAFGIADGEGTNYGLYGSAGLGLNNYGVYGSIGTGTGYAGYFNGALYASSSSSGVKSFLIDHPLDPENRLLEHSSVESSERLNLYRGVLVTDGKGFGKITPPDWFYALNDDIQVQLTVVDDSDDFVLSKVVRHEKDGSVLIRTSKPGTRVNWMLNGVRKDPTSRAIPMVVEQDKPEHLRGKYLNPRAYGFSDDRAMYPPKTEENKRNP
ncbi:MAG TPA: hypothetical protein PKA27_11590 [Fimbriimonadaceae bacterium]|nr:hypothetical protein [Fimbriimonadaceae bacterium]